MDIVYEQYFHVLIEANHFTPQICADMYLSKLKLTFESSLLSYLTLSFFLINIHTDMKNDKLQ